MLRPVECTLVIAFLVTATYGSLPTPSPLSAVFSSMLDDYDLPPCNITSTPSALVGRNYSLYIYNIHQQILAVREGAEQLEKEWASQQNVQNERRKQLANFRAATSGNAKARYRYLEVLIATNQKELEQVENELRKTEKVANWLDCELALAEKNEDTAELETGAIDEPSDKSPVRFTQSDVQSLEEPEEWAQT